VKFIDEAIITVQSGNGGSGCVSFRRERFIPRGGPDGGDGGTGGGVILVASPQKRTLHHFHYKKHYKAQNGTNGQGKQKTGKTGKNIVIEVPPGTLVRNLETGQMLKDLTQSGETFTILKGGRGGQGNTHFKTSTNRSPRFAQPGEAGQSLTIKLELKLLADVGIIGLPNAGKSTLIRAVSSAQPKIGDYPFTTLTPNLGVVHARTEAPFVIADIPGLIEGAHKGAGLGIRFLRHIERTRILVHLIDALSIDPDNPLQGLQSINTELAQYSESLIEKPQILVLNKLDMPGSQKAAKIFQSALTDKKVILISAITGKGLKALISKITTLLKKTHDSRY
jgi:GTP-binding protein